MHSSHRFLPSGGRRRSFIARALLSLDNLGGIMTAAAAARVPQIAASVVCAHWLATNPERLPVD
jgi:hypothetical protein